MLLPALPIARYKIARYKMGVLERVIVKHTTKRLKNEGRARRCLVSFALLAPLAGCASPINRFHAYEGGVIAQHPPPPPGLNRPYPNLSAVPPRPQAISPADQRAIRAGLLAENSKENQLPAPAGGVSIAAKTPPVSRVIPPLLLGFAPGSAILSTTERQMVSAFAAQRGTLMIRAAGFAAERNQAGLRLALLRATAIANALTDSGVPGSFIRLAALTGAQGGAVQLFVPTHP